MNINTDATGSLLILSIEILFVILIGFIGAATGFFIMCVLYVSWPWFTRTTMPDDLEKRLFTIITRSSVAIAVVLYVILRTYLIIANP